MQTSPTSQWNPNQLSQLGPRVWVVLNPAQQRILDELRGPSEQRPLFDPGLAIELRERLDSELRMLAGGLEKPLWVSKQVLQRVMGCETHHLAEQELGFSWTLPAVRGSVVHKAIQLSVTWKGEPQALELVDEAIVRLIDDPQGGDLSGFLAQCSQGEIADLKSEAGDLCCKFLEQWPRLVPAWKPRSESRLRVEVADGKVILHGKADLTLGAAEGHTAGRLIVDFKTGRSGLHHRDDLRFYALLDTLTIGVPPFRLASYYLDEATGHPEDVTEEVLEAALRRTIAGVGRLIELELGLRSPRLTPNAACAWCPLKATCAGAIEWRDAQRKDEEFDW